MRKGFTLLEILVVIAISALIVAIVIVYSNASRNQVALSVESTKIGGLILQAKQLAAATASAGSARVCGYGISFDFTNQDYSLFVYTPAGSQGQNGKCPSLTAIESSTYTFNSGTDMAEYSPSTWQVHFAQGVVLQQDASNCTSADVILFYPPRPTTLMVQDGQHFENTTSSYVDLVTADGSASENIQITPAGQVSF